MNKNILQNRKLRQGSMATAITVVFIAVIVLLNMLVSSLASRYDLSLDLTEDDIFTLSDASVEYLQALSKDVSIYVLNSEQAFTAEGTHMLQANEIIKKYALQSEHIAVRYVDLLQNPDFAALYPSLRPQTNYIIVACGEDAQMFSPDDLFNLQIYGESYYITSSRAEQTITSAIVAVTSDEIVKVAVLAGHGESEVPSLLNRMALNNYELAQVRLSSQTIADDIKFVIIAAPMSDYTEDELKQLDRFLYNNGEYGRTLLYIASLEQPELPALDAFLQQWGVHVGMGTVFETDYYMLASNSIFSTNAYYAEDHYSYVAQRSGLMVYMPNARPLETSTGSGANVTTLLSFSQATGVRPADYAVDEWTYTADDISGPYPALTLSQRTGDSGGTSNVLVSASALAFDEGVLVEPSFANSSYFLSLFGELVEREDNVIIESKTIGSTGLNMSYAQVLTWGYSFFLLLPLLVLTIGAVVFVRRRHM